MKLHFKIKFPNSAAIQKFSFFVRTQTWTFSLWSDISENLNFKHAIRTERIVISFFMVITNGLIRSFESKIILILTYFIMFQSGYLFAQSENDSTRHYSGPFQKERFLTGLNGNISSGAFSTSSSNNQKTFDNSYSFGTKSGFFVKDKWAVGGDFKISRSSQNSTISYSSELLQLGPWSRYYLSDHDYGSLFPEISIFYANSREDSQILNGPQNFHEALNTRGGGIEVGAGFTYIIDNKVGFDLVLSYKSIFLSGTKEDFINNTQTKESVFTDVISFNFGFTIFIDEFFF
ncbi:hypothetical protein [Flexithrix dorotheae]|uniref:hypothetical protein n=1 Tax=Flexithrix dorotheae TaxID=70993 RepID=UPI000363A191|nr:hypothetical protein [Flexithrix dorotheae]